MRSALCALSLTAVAARAQVPVRVAADYAEGERLFDEGLYWDAAAKFEKVYAAPNAEGRAADAAYAAGQCRRVMGDFPTALYYYHRAWVAYSQSPTPDAEGWRGAIGENLNVVLKNLSVVTLKLPVAEGDGKRQLCSLRVDGKPLLRYSQEQLESLRLATSTTSKKPVDFAPLSSALADGGLAGMRSVPRSARRDHRCYDQDITLLVDRAQDHGVSYIWRRDGQREGSALIDIKKADLLRGHNVVRISEQPAKLSFHFQDSKGASLDELVTPRDFSAFLTPLNASEEIPVLKTTNVVPASSYRLSVDVIGWGEAGVPERITLRPGEAQTIPVELQPPLYKQPWFLWAVIGVGVVGTGIFAYTQLNRADEHASMPTGNLGWTVQVR
jgi:hypothetical protein